MKKIFNIILFSIFIFLLCTVKSYAVEQVDNSLKIYDYGEFLTEEEKIELKSLIDDYIDKYNMDMVIVTKKDYPYNSMQSYAEDFYDYNNFGLGKTNDGIILFFNIDYEGPTAYIVTTGQAILMYDDARIDGLLAHMKGEKINGNYAMIKEFVTQSAEYADKGIPESNKHMYIDKNGDYKEKKEYPFALIFSMSLVITFVVVCILAGKNDTVKSAINATIYFVSKSFNITTSKDKFVNSYTSKHRIESSTSSSGGRSHHSGGSSISRGSSGISHGGGGRRL